MPVSRTTKPKLPIPYWQSECGRATVYVGDCRDVMVAMAPNQFHAVVTDPPYGLEFMGREWDAPWKNEGKIEVCDDGMDESHPFRDGTRRVVYGLSNPQGFQAWFLKCAEGMLHVAKTGAHLLSFGGTRMWHRMVCAVEDAGWEIRDTIMWVYGSGFPKGQDVSKAIDKTLGFDRTEVLGKGQAALAIGQFNSKEAGSGGYGYKEDYNVTAPATDAARQWQGWNTALKPAVEPIVLARKPILGSVAQCVLDNGTGAINVDGCRVGTEEMLATASDGTFKSNNTSMAGHNTGRINVGVKSGRHPANLIHDGSDEVLDLFPQTGPSKATMRGELHGVIYGGGKGPSGLDTMRGHDDNGGSAARFFYTAKADKTDRPHGKEATVHPTVKPLDLMQYLVRLICVPGGTVLDPFMGSGSTGCAAIMEGMRFVGIEQSEEYADIAIGRLKLVLAGKPVGDTPDVPTSPTRRTDGAPPPLRKLRGT